MNANIETGKHLTRLREQHNISQTELAEKIDVSRYEISKWEDGVSLPDTESLIKLSKLYKIPLDDILFTESSPTANKSGEAVNYKALLSVVFISIAAYFLIGFLFNIWHPSWLIFLIIPFYYIIADKTESGKRSKNYSIYSLILVIIYLLLSFVFSIWHPLWLIFLTIPIYYWLVNRKYKAKSE